MTRTAASQGGEHAKLFERLFDEGSALGLTEAQLVDRFAANRDESAFAALVDRHGPMVLGVCRRFLRDPNDVDDAFQAVFLILARKAAGLREKELLANWLYGVACRVAIRSRATAARRAVGDPGDRLETDARKPTAVPPAEILARREDEVRLHEEVGRLPMRYRAPVVACYFEGKTHEEAAASLGCPVGTVKGRLARARDLLRRRLASRGVVTPAALVSATLAAADLRAAVPPALAARTLTTSLALTASSAAWMTAAALSTPARSLAQGVIQAMFYSHLKVLAIPALLVGSALVAGGASLAASWRDVTAFNEESPAPAAKGFEEPAAPIRSGQLRPEDLLKRIARDSLKYKQSLDYFEFDAIDVKGDLSTKLQTALKIHRGRVDPIVKELRSTVATDGASQALLNSFADFLARSSQRETPELDPVIQGLNHLIEMYGSFRMAIKWAQEDDQGARAIGRTTAEAALRYTTRLEPDLKRLRWLATQNEAARDLFNAYADYLEKFVTLDEQSAFKRMLANDEPQVRANAEAATQFKGPEPAQPTNPAPPRTVAAQADQPQSPHVTTGADGGGGFGGFSGPGPAEIRQDIAGLAAMIGKVDEDPASAAVRGALNLPATLRAGAGSTLGSLLNQIKSSQFAEGKKIPVYVDPVGLEDANATLDSPVSIDLEDVPLRFSLRVVLKQLGLAYCVRDGVLIISSIEGIQQELLEAEKEMMGLHPDKVIYGPNGPTLQGMGQPGGMM